MSEAERNREPLSKSDLSENEQKLINAVNNKMYDDVAVLLGESDVRVDCIDPYGNTPLQLAAFKGSFDICKLLLSHGSQVNKHDNEHGYSALMFAALSGNQEICRLLLEAGADASFANRIGRTASDMAAFTGQHQCASVINNFLEDDWLEVYTKKQGPDGKQRLPSQLVVPLHKLLQTYNVHPVNVILYVREHPEFLQHEKSILYVLEDIVERQMKDKHTNEVMALKVHIIFATLKSMYKFVTEQVEAGKTEREALTLLAKSLLETKEHNIPERLEMFIRQCIREFPFHQSVLFQQIVRLLSRAPTGNHPPFGAWKAVHQVLMGQRMLSDEVFCAACGNPSAKKRCAVCKCVNYCSADCQKLHWFTHKKWCEKFARGEGPKCPFSDMLG